MEINVLDTTFKRDMSNRSLMETDVRKRDEYLTRKSMMKTNLEQTKELKTLKEQMEELRLQMNLLLKKEK